VDKFLAMKKIVPSLIIIFLQSQFCKAQIEYIEVNSKILKSTRQLKLQIPRNYDSDNKKTYPLIFVFDGDYLFEPVAGIVDYLSYWEEIPEAFVVGINQVGSRMDDGRFDKKEFLPIGTGAQFFDFIQLEILKYMRENYNIGNFAVVVGHDYMANFMNFFLFSNKIQFQGFINLSPDIPDALIPFIKEQLKNSKEKIWYSLTTGSNDLPFLKAKTEQLNETFSTIENDLVSISYKSFENTNHYSLVPYGLPYSLNKIFEPYTPIDDVEFKKKLSKAENPVTYLEDKYELINTLYDVEKPVRIADIMKVSKLIEKNENWELYQDLSKIAKRNHPNTLLFDYFSGRYFQEIGKPKKAIKAYQSGYSYQEAGGITKDMLLDKADKLKEIFGY
jgi:predicted alpha/beta superfamily hydrolase